jgi:hypothetical protein
MPGIILAWHGSGMSGWLIIEKPAVYVHVSENLKKCICVRFLSIVGSQQDPLFKRQNFRGKITTIPNLKAVEMIKNIDQDCITMVMETFEITCLIHHHFDYPTLSSAELTTPG